MKKIFNVGTTTKIAAMGYVGTPLTTLSPYSDIYQITDEELEAICKELYANAVLNGGSINGIDMVDATDEDIAIDLVAYDSTLGAIHTTDDGQYEDLIEHLAKIVKKVRADDLG